MNEIVIPRFSNEADEAAWWDAHRSEIEANIQECIQQGSYLRKGSMPPKSESSCEQ
jgi:hypothetical protein